MASKVNPEMIIVAREARAMTQEELAKRLLTTQGRLSKLEAGLLSVTADDLASLSKVLDFPESFFSQTDRVYGFGSPCFYHRKRTKLPVAELRQIQARLNIFRFHITRLLRGVEIGLTSDFVRMDVDENGGPENVARLVRHQWNFGAGPIRNVVNAVESAGAIVYAMPFGSRSIDAISQVAPGCPPVIFINEDIPGDRQRFTLMHEVGHIIMHQLPSDNMEEQADRFAAEFLMPEFDIKSHLRNLKMLALPGLKTTWGTSMSSLIKRAFDTGGITDRRYRSLMTELSAEGWRLNEPVVVPREEPTVFANVLNTYLTSHGYTLTQLARMVNAKESRVAAYFKNDQGGSLRIVG